MKETMGSALTNRPQTPYPKGGDVSMAEQGLEEEHMGENVRKATDQLEMAAKLGKKARQRASARDFLAKYKGKLPIDMEGKLKEVAGESKTKGSSFGPEEQKPAIKTGPATWKNKANDQPVVITGYLGKKDGRDYVSIEGYDTGIPLDEIEFPKTAKKQFQQPNEGDNKEEVGVSEILDKEAGNLIKRFIQEGGIKDEGRSKQFKEDLAKRIDALQGERASKSEDNEGGKGEIEQIEEKIRQLQGISAQIEEERVRSSPSLMEEGEGRDGYVLAKKAREFVERIRARKPGLDPNNIAELMPEEIVERTKLVSDIKTFIDATSDINTSQFRTEILMATRYFKELREGLASRIIFKPFEERTEMNQYEIEWYASSNLNILLGFMSRDDPEKYKEYFSLKTAAQFFHTMNSSILAGNFENYSRVAENISYQHFLNMEKVKGSGLVMRLYEQKYKDFLARDKRITEEGYDELKQEIEVIFRKMNEKGLIRSEYEKYRQEKNSWKMDEWEINKALGAGRTFFNITLRGAENIATGQLPEISGRKQYASFPQEDMVRILNWNEWFLRRFQLGNVMHGVEFLDKTTGKYQEFLKYKGDKQDKNKIVEFGGVNVRGMENASQYRTSGVFSGWRLENMAFNRISFKPEGEDKKITVMEFMDRKTTIDKKRVIKARIDAKLKNSDIEPKDAVTEQDQKDYLEALRPLVENLDIGLSMFIKNVNTGGNGKLGYLFRQEVWKKIADTNIPLMLDYLTNLEYAEDTPDKAKTLQQLKDEVAKDWTDEKFTLFKNKVLLRHERMIKKAMGEESSSLSEVSEDEKYDTREEELIRRIREEGSKLAPHLADVVFPYTPFMNDMPFEDIDYRGPGQTFYKRRTGGDLGGYNEGQQAYIQIMSNPGGLNAEKAIEAMGKIVKGVAGPEGIGSAQEANFANFEVLLDVLETEPGKRQAIFKQLLELTRSPTSLARKWAGIKAESFTEAEVLSLIDQSVRAGVVSPELARYMRRKKKLGISSILWMLFRDVFLLTPVIFGAEFAEKVIKDK